ncbi:LpqB family beta-propeller domain-containing protein [Steroidobacter sp.]|uniref:LpqB family beta-propeller domain-containing protein n=1 Tax=Steroidobacter sp. TaxID=1978227 RepID=UPI001A51A2A2|nr:LpqB family beta-propeller domain-containing protein [Steroidobacter sp.]MBL8268725.1 CehA/McbA family metallohydrolase [Steroidobacter sp.]
MIDRTVLSAVLLLLAMTTEVHADWRHRYPKLQSFGHHLYFEAYNLPTLNAGPTDPAPSPDGRHVAFAARGWLWLLDLETHVARRITSGAHMDSRPAWSPDGRHLAFVRDDTRDTSIVMLDLNENREQLLAGEPVLELDPTFSPDGRFLYYSSATAGDLDLWRLEFATGQRTRLTDHKGAVLRPLVHPDGERVLYFFDSGSGPDEIRIHDLSDGNERTLYAGNILSHSRPALSPDGRTVAVTLPSSSEPELRLLPFDEPRSAIVLSRGLPLTPAWSAEGKDIYFTESDAQERMVLKRVPYAGGNVIDVPIHAWHWGVPTAQLRIKGDAARLAVVDAQGHPVLPDAGQPKFDLASGAIYFFSPGTTEITVPAGDVRISAVRGPTTPLKVIRENIEAGTTRDISIKLEPVWDTRAAGYISADHHLHLNYGGPYRLTPEDLLLQMRAEDLDFATPTVANLHERLEDRQYWGWQQLSEPPFLQFSQEVRPHFFGHIGIIGANELFWPWFWGPYYESYRWDDRLNADALRHARKQGGVNVYVHPYPTPHSLIPDAVLGEVDLYELSCLWSDALGAAGVWYQLLNLGLPIAPSAGSDSMANFFRIMPVGATRAYVRTPQPFKLDDYLRDLKAGRSFVTNGPLLDLRVAAARPGDVLDEKSAAVQWHLDVYSAVAFDKLELLINGAVVWQGSGLTKAGKRSFSGSIAIPEGGWIAARAHGGRISSWPAMDDYAFAHTSPIWIGRRGSTLPATERAAASALLKIVSSSEEKLRKAFEGAPIPRLQSHFEKARQTLQQRLSETE